MAISIKILLRLMSNSLLPLFSFSSFVVSDLRLKSLNYFFCSLTPVNGVKEWSNFISLCICLYKHGFVSGLSYSVFFFLVL